jgi:hypothetical protein
MAHGFNNWIAYLLSELDNEGSPAFRAAEKPLDFYENFNQLSMSDMKLVVAGSPGTHSFLLMPTYGSGGLKLVHHLRLASTVRDDGAFTSYLLGIVGGKGTNTFRSLTLDSIRDGYVKTKKLPIPSIEQFLACSSTAEFVSLRGGADSPTPAEALAGSFNSFAIHPQLIPCLSPSVFYAQDLAMTIITNARSGDHEEEEEGKKESDDSKDKGSAPSSTKVTVSGVGSAGSGLCGVGPQDLQPPQVALGCRKPYLSIQRNSGPPGRCRFRFGV